MSGRSAPGTAVHELSIATSLVELSTEALERAGEAGPVESVQIRVGAMSGVVVEALEFAWEVASQDTACAGARLDIEAVAVRVRCPSCAAETELDDPPQFRCGSCGTPTADILAGRELDLVSLELHDDPPGPSKEPNPETAHP